MPKTIRNKYDEYLTYENLLKAHNNSKKGKTHRKNIIKFNLRQEEYIMWLYENLKNMTYRHGGYRTFYVTEPKLRKIEASKYMDRIVHTWYVESFLKQTFMKQFISNSYACIEGKGMHLAALDVKKGMKKAKKQWGEYYILKMDIAKYFPSINKDILFNIMKKKINDHKVLWLTKEILYSKKDVKGIPIRKLYITNICKYLFK